MSGKEGGSGGTIRALLVGIDAYAGEHRLHGSVNDVMETKALLEQRYGARGDDIEVILDGEATADAVEAGIEWLSAPTGDRGPRLFHYSGHGAFVADESGDEADGRDECLVPVDFDRRGPAKRGLINDDTLRRLYRNIDGANHLLLIMDACHSGGVQKDSERDLAYRFISLPGERERAALAALRNRGARAAAVDAAVEEATRAAGGALSRQKIEEIVKDTLAGYGKKHFAVELVSGDVTLIAACGADQQAAETRFGGRYRGALSHLLQKALREGVVVYEELIARVGKDLKARGLEQEPRLECSVENRSRSFLLR